MEVIEFLFRKAGFLKVVAEVIASDLRRSTACLLPGKVVQLPPLVSWKEFHSMQDHCSTDNRVVLVSAKRAEDTGSCG